ncbi:Type-1 restriction enzyme MjaXIP specificity protein [uncultured archaeon]|nr:Type-1 restriction enzyme MjaXIP specificity protein [uncultured archaeon]
MRVVRLARLREIAIVLKGKKPSMTIDAPTDDALPYILIEAFGGKYKAFTKDPACVRCYRDDTIVVADGANSGLASINHNGFLGSTLVAVRPDQSKVNALYMFFFIRANFKTFNTRTRGAAVPHLDIELLLDLELPLPSLAEQERIVRILEEADALLRLRANSDKRLTQTVPAIFFESFGDPTSNSRGLPIVKLGDIARIERGKFTPRPRNDPAYFGGPYPFIQTGDISSSGGLLSNWQQTLNERGIAVSKQFPTGTIVFAIVGATIGQTAILQVPVYCTDSIVGIQVDPKHAYTEYVEFVLRSRRRLLLAQAPDAARANLNLVIIRDLLIPLASVDAQRDFVKRCAEIRHLETVQAASRQRLDDLFQSLLQQAFQGEL